MTVGQGFEAVALSQARRLYGLAFSIKRLRFVRPDGTLVREVQLPHADLDPAEVLSTGGDQVFFTLRQHLYSVGADGVSHDHGALNTQGSLPSDVVVSPDGRQWAWAETDLYRDTGPVRTVHDRLYVAGDGQSRRLVYTSTHQIQPGQGETVDTDVAWSERGIVVARMPVGVGGLIPFKFGVEPRLVDPRTGTVQQLAGCDTFNDFGPDGSYVCANSGAFRGNDGIVTIFDRRGTVRRRSPTARRCSAPAMPSSAPTGRASPSRWRAPTARPTATGAPMWSEIASGHITQPGPAGDLLTDWLPDGSLVLSPPDGGGVVRVALDGHTTAIGPGGWLGVVHR